MGIGDTIVALTICLIGGPGFFLIVILIAKAVARVELAVGHQCTFDTSNVKMRWVVAAILGVFPVVGLILSLDNRDFSMLWVSLIGAAIAAVVFPVGFVLLFILSQVGSVFISGFLIGISKIIEIIRFGKRRL